MNRIALLDPREWLRRHNFHGWFVNSAEGVRQPFEGSPTATVERVERIRARKVCPDCGEPWENDWTKPCGRGRRSSR